MSSTMITRKLQAAVASTSGRPAQAVPFGLAVDRSRAIQHKYMKTFGAFTEASKRKAVQMRSQKEDRKAEPAPVTASSEESPFFEPLIRGLVLGVGAGILCELGHVAFKVTNIASDGMTHMPSAAQFYEQLKPLFVWDHAVALVFWLLFYGIEAAAILAILREYPDDKQASNVIRSTITLPQRLMPLKLSSVKRAVHTLVHGRAPQAATAEQGASPSAFRGGAGAPALPGPRASSSSGGAGTAVLERPRPTAEPADAAKAPPKTAEPKRRAPQRPCEDEERCGDGEARTAAAQASALARARAAAGLRPGQLDPGSPLVAPKGPKEAQDDKRRKELDDRRAYLQNFWYAAAISEKVTDKPMKVDILSRTVTLWRGEDGAVHCLDNVCPHRGAPLSGGWSATKNGKSCVVCPYHGWAFNGEGSLEEVPSQAPGVAFPKRPLVESYPVQERGGFVWLFFGAKGLPADERPPLPLVLELEDPNWRAVYGEMEFDCPHWSVFENALDMAHIHYLHSSSFGNQDNPVIHDMAVKRDTWSVQADFSIHNKPVNPLWNWTRVPQVPVTAKALLPSTSYVKIQLAHGVQMITYVNTVPIDEHRAINRFCLIRNFATSPLFDAYTRKSMFNILGEDKAMIEQLKPEALSSEVSLEADKPQIAFRKLRQEWIDMGYGVQPEQVARYSGSLRLDM